MKLPSIQYLINQSKASLLRFPFVILSSIAAACVGVYWIEFRNGIVNPFPYVNLLLTMALGIPLYLCAAILGMKRRFDLKLNAVGVVVVTVVLALVYFSLPHADVTHNTLVPYVRYGIFALIAHLLVAFTPYLRGGEMNGFWHYNKVLFSRFLVSIFYFWALSSGLALALVALDELFGITIHPETYSEVIVIVIGFFNTWFFVSGIPENLDDLEKDNNYPAGIKIFTQYILMPLLFLYIAILYAYSIKIVAYWVWPKGIITYLVSGVAVLGIFNHLLIYPRTGLEKESWVKRFSLLYYYILLPLIALLFVAAWIRIADYGVTINRYIVVLLGIWLSLVSFYFLLRQTNIKFIPISLALILIPMSFGPWSMFSVSERSQVNRLKAILEKNTLLVEGKVQGEVIWDTNGLPKFYSRHDNTNADRIADSTHNEIRSILNYLDRNHGLSMVRPFFKQNIDSLITLAETVKGIKTGKSAPRIRESDIYMRTLGLQPLYLYRRRNAYLAKKSIATVVTRYDYIVNIRHAMDANSAEHTTDDRTNTFEVDGQVCRLVYTNREKSHLAFIAGQDTILFRLDDLIDVLKNEFGESEVLDINKKKMTLKKASPTFEAKLEVSSVSAPSDKKDEFYSTQGYLFLKKRERKESAD